MTVKDNATTKTFYARLFEEEAARLMIAARLTASVAIMKKDTRITPPQEILSAEKASGRKPIRAMADWRTNSPDFS